MVLVAEEEFVLDCGYELCDKDKFHLFPKGWILGGANDLDPSADPRWMPTSYIYYDDKFKEIFRTCGPLCDEEAFDLFTWVAGFGPSWKPKYLAVRRPNDQKEQMLPVQYDKATDSVNDLEVK